jgi:hypothetical protein
MMRFYNQQHRFYCGVDLHARTLSFCIRDASRAIVRQQTIAADPQAFLQAVAPCRDGQRLASAGDDRTIKVWDGTPLETLRP